jgi:hypothetical protein
MGRGIWIIEGQKATEKIPEVKRLKCGEIKVWKCSAPLSFGIDQFYSAP